jgi:hypothetical protein
MILYIFFIAVSFICLPFSLYKIHNTLRIAKKGVEITATNISIKHRFFGVMVIFEYKFDGIKYYKVKYYHFIFFPEKDRLKLLVDPINPAKFIILEFKKKSIISLVRERNS